MTDRRNQQIKKEGRKKRKHSEKHIRKERKHLVTKKQRRNE
jgi:hypothetical protein